MARRADRGQSPPMDLRAELLAKARRDVVTARAVYALDMYGYTDGRIGVVGGYAQSRIEALEAGEPLVVAGYEIKIRPIHPPVDGQHVHYRVEPDGSVTPVVAVHDPDDPSTIADWREV